MSNLSSLASITCKLTPSTSNLGKVEATASKLLFTWRPNEIGGQRGRFVSERLIGQDVSVQPIRNVVSFALIANTF